MFKKLSVVCQVAQANHLVKLIFLNNGFSHAFSVVQCVEPAKSRFILLQHWHMLELGTAEVGV